ncbi:MAG: TIGR00730 family Rossman fold protein [Actinobacteria bacterium]|nr:TIGR00730 family Rossman fold protein [Actinomycetota bacterium]
MTTHSAGAPSPFERDLREEVERFLAEGPSLLDQKIMANTVKDLRKAFSLLAQVEGRPKVTIFGSARTASPDPLYEQTVRVAGELAAKGWMVITGAGPGIMEAGMVGAGRDSSIGVSIQLPFENEANEIIAGDDKHITLKYFFTRKFALTKASQAFICMPGGFGTLDELFELLTLTQTGKGTPVPIVLLDVPGDPYWQQVDDFVRDQMASRGLISPDDRALYLTTNDAVAAANEITAFYSNFHSLRFVGQRLVLRLRSLPDPQGLASLNEMFSHLCVEGGIEPTQPLPAETRDDDNLGLPRLVLRFDRRSFGELRLLIDAVNRLVGN